jgi:TorA maturation chaperone TorD
MTDLSMELAAARATIYEFLSASFSEPPSREILQTLVQALADPSVIRLFSGGIDSAIDALRACAVQAIERETAMSEVRQEFMDLFKVPGSKYVAPYESVYRDSREVEGTKVGGLLMGPSAIDAQRWYRLGAAEMTDQNKELPDHIAVELGFVAYLCHKELEFASAGDDTHFQRAKEMQRDFLALHILPWFGELCDRITQKSDYTYFPSLGRFALTFVEHDLISL